MSDREILDSWKEISEYLDRSRKTCQRWEVDYGMPVHRLDGSPKARVFAYKDEIDRWKVDLAHGKESQSKRIPFRLAGVVAVILIFTAALILLFRSRNESTESLRVVIPRPFLAEPEVLEGNPAWSPLGDLIAFDSNRSGSRDVWICDRSGFNPLNLTANSSAADCYPTWSPDGHWIAFFSDRDSPGLYTMTATGGDIKKVTDIEAGLFWFTLTWSNENELIYTDRHAVNGRLNIFAISPSGKDRRCLTYDVAEFSQAHNGAISPSGNLLAWTHSTNQNSPIFVLRIGSGEVEKLEVKALMPRWHPNGEVIYFLTQQERFRNLWSVKVDPETGNIKKEPAPVTQSLRINCFAIGPEGREALITLFHNRRNLWRFQLNESGIPIIESGERLTEGDFLDSNAKWIPGTNEVSFISNRRGIRGIWNLQLDPQRKLTQITNGPHELEYHTLSPRGKWIAASRIIPYLMRPDGSEYRELDPIFRTEFSEANICDWSADGRFIVFSSEKGLGLAEMDEDSGKVLSTYLLGIPRNLETGVAWHAYFSPDSRYIVYESSESGDFDIWISSIDGMDVRPLVVRPFDDRQPIWAHAQSCIYFLSSRGSRPGVYRVPVDDSGYPLGEPEFCYKSQDGFRGFHSWKSVSFSDSGVLISVSEADSDIWILDLK